MRSIFIRANTYFHEGSGVSYFHYKLYVDGELFYSPEHPSNGYGSQYEYDALRYLEENHPDMKGADTPFIHDWIRRQGIDLYTSLSEVKSRKKLNQYL